jgi:hypothetical protein
MKTRNLLMAVALPTLFAACSQDEALVNVTPETQYKGVPLENVTLSFNKEEGAETRMTNDGWNLKWGAGDEVGLVWVNAPEILNQFNRGETYDPTVLPGTAFWASNTRMTCSDPANSIFEMRDGQVLEGQYFAYYPYTDRYKVDGKFGSSIDKEQHQKSTIDQDGILSYIAENMPWISRRADRKSTETNKNATFIYTLQNEEAGMSKAINMEMFRFANLLDARIAFEKGTTTTIDPADVKIESVDLKVVPVSTAAIGWKKNSRIATSGLFNMGKLRRYVSGVYDEFGILSLYDKTKYELPKVVDGQDGLFVNDNLVSQITTVIEEPTASAGGRVNFLLMPYTVKDTYFTTDNYTLALTIHTNYGVVTVDETQWYRYKGSDPNGIFVMGPAAVAGSDFEVIKDKEHFYAGEDGWANRTGAFCTRYMTINVDDLAFESSCIETLEDLLAAIERINSRNAVNKRFDLCIDGKENTLTLSNFDWSASSSTSDAISTFIKAGNTLYLNEHSGKVVTVKFTNMNNISAGQLVNNGKKLDIVVADYATLNVNNDFTTGIFATEANATLNVNAAKLTTGVATLNGTTNINIVDAKAGELNIASRSINNGTIEVKGTLGFARNANVTNNGTVNLYYTAAVQGVASYNATLNNAGIINYYYAKAANKKNVTITNISDGKFLAEWNNGIVPGTDNEKKTDFMKLANAYGVTHYIISKASEANSESWNLNNALEIVVKKGVKLTFNPMNNSKQGLTAAKALLYFEGNNTLTATGSYATYAYVYVKDITLAYGQTLTNDVEVRATGTFKGEEDAAGNAKYTVNNNGYIYGGKCLEQTGTTTWNTHKYGVKP